MPKSRSRRQPPRRPVPQRRPAAPQVPPPTAPGFRGAVERRSTPVLTWFAARPKALLPIASLALLLGGFLAPAPVAVPLLVLLLLVVTWLTYLSWPAVDRGGRVIRVTTVLLVCLAIATTAAGS